MSNLPAEYVIYCDESGDPGLKPTASEWFIVSAVVLRASNDAQVKDWIAKIKEPMRSQRRHDLHFNKLDDTMRLRAVEHLAGLPVRCFTVLSSKRNMLGY